ncbi:MAG: response regulator [Spirochaetota bacterium]
MKTVLVVDDDPQMNQLIQACLEPLGLEIQFAASGRQALGMTTAFRPNLIIADILMPEMDGTTFVSELWKLLDFRSVPVIFLTGLISKAEERFHTDLLGNHCLLAKPFAPAELRALVQKLVV